MIFEHLNINGPLVIKPNRIEDERGWFSEVLRMSELSDIIGPKAFVQVNQSFSKHKGTIRGLHYQESPRSQGKLIRCIRGRILDIALDMRRSSKFFGQHVAIELSNKDGYNFWIPEGFAHGFLTLEENTEILYYVTDYYSSDHDRGILWNDPELAINWGITPNAVTVSEKDCNWPILRDIVDIFP